MYEPNDYTHTYTTKYVTKPKYRVGNQFFRGDQSWPGIDQQLSGNFKPGPSSGGVEKVDHQHPNKLLRYSKCNFGSDTFKSQHYSSRNDIICINCNGVGHAFKDCKMPIISYGIIAWRRPKRDRPWIEYLLIQRKDTIGYIDFIRGKYSNQSMIKNLFEEMTDEERMRLATFDFKKIWQDLWNNKSSRIYINEYEKSKSKFEKLNIQGMLNGTPKSKWKDNGFEYTKGRKNINETNIECAKREFIEESGYKEHEFVVMERVEEISELFFGSNGKRYKHIYYIAMMLTDRDPVVDPNNIIQSGEIRKIGWFPFNKCINMFRSYHTSKRQVLYQVDDIIKKKTQ